MQEAMDYLNMVPSEAGDPVAVLRDRIYRASPGAGADGGAPPPFPFSTEDVSTAPSGAVQDQTSGIQSVSRSGSGQERVEELV